MNTDKVFKMCFKFLVIAMMIGGLLMFFMGIAGAAPGYPPTRGTLAALASAVQPLTASGTSLPSVAGYSEGDLFILASTSPILYRLQSSAWATMTSMVSGGSGGGISTATLEAYLASVTAGVGISTDTVDAHIASHSNKTVDPHGSIEQITEKLIIGSGTPDAEVKRLSTGTVQIASWVVIPPELATPSAPIATGTFWNDKNTGRVKVYDGSAWNNLW